jgi:Leucine-rich repeat (LRR) protein
MEDRTEEDVEREITSAIKENSDTLSLSHLQRGSNLPKTLLDIPNLRHLTISYSYSVDIPSWLADIKTLESLELEEGGDISELLPHIGKLERLRKLKIAYMEGFSEFPATLKNLRHLTELNIDGADFEIFPKEIVGLANLESFSYIYCDCELSDVFDTLAQLPNLKRLYFVYFADHKDGDVLPESFINLQSLEEIHFENWIYLNCLPENIGDMRNLKVLNLSNSDSQIGYDANIRSLPDSLGDLPNLETLDIFGCQYITQLPAGFARVSTLKDIDIIDSGITELRLTDEQWRRLESLRMQGIPPDFALCANLKNFAWKTSNVSVSGMTVYGIEKRVDLQLECLHNLESLQLYGGTFDSLDFLESMPKLRRLKLSCNFDCLPKWLWKLNHLEGIDIWGAASLKNLPECIADMKSLKELHIYASGVQTAPDFFKHREDMIIDIRKGV